MAEQRPKVLDKVVDTLRTYPEPNVSSPRITGLARVRALNGPEREPPRLSRGAPQPR